jgi:hypothetical protein
MIHVVIVLVITLLYTLFGVEELRLSGTHAGGKKHRRTINNKSDDVMSSIPEHMRNKIILNPIVNAQPTNELFIKDTGSLPVFLDIEKEMSNGCIKGQSFWDSLEKTVIDGFNVAIIKKGMNIYKMFAGFVTWNHIEQHCRDNMGNPSWFSNKYTCYNLASIAWGSVVSFKVKKDIVLIDSFDEDNHKKLIHIMKNAGMEDVADIYNMRMGYMYTHEQRIKEFMNSYSSYRSFWYYDKPVYSDRGHHFCNSRRPKNINPSHTYKGSHSTDVNIFRRILSKYKNIDGIIRPDSFSPIDDNGHILEEEYLIKCKSILDKTSFDYDDPISWTNWKLPFVLPKEGCNLRGIVIKIMSVSSELHKNNRFRQVKYYINNTSTDVPVNFNKQIMFYDINKFVPITTPYITVLSDYDNIKYVKRFIDEFGPNHISTEKNSSQLIAIGNPDIALSIINIEATNISNNNMTIQREAIRAVINERSYIFTTLTPSGICLKIEKRDNVNKQDSSMRITQLHKIIQHTPDYIIGNMQFTCTSPEHEYMTKNGYTLTHNCDANSTPDGRTDLCFVKNSLPASTTDSNFLVRINYSPHTPMLQKIPT